MVFDIITIIIVVVFAGLASHKMYNTCGCVHGDITNRSVCFTVGDDGEVSGLLLDLDDRLPEDFTRDVTVKVKEME